MAKKLISEHPLLSQLYDKERNPFGLFSSIFIHDTQTMIWWKCPQCGESYQRSPHQQMHTSHLCRSCSRVKQTQKAREELTELGQSIASDSALMSSWDHERNEPGSENLISTGDCRKKVYWLCPKCQQSYQRDPYKQRTGSGLCNDCTIKENAFKKIEGHTVFDNKELMGFWDSSRNPKGLEYSISERNDSVDIWWICPSCKISYKRKAVSQLKCNGLCKSCSSKQSRAEKKNIYNKDTKFICDCDELKIDFDYANNPEGTDRSVSAKSDYISVYWICRNCHQSYERTPSKQLKSSRTCKTCSSKLHGENMRQKYANGSIKVNYKFSCIKDYPELCKCLSSPDDALVNGLPIKSEQEVEWVCQKCNSIFKKSVNKLYNTFHSRGIIQCKDCQHKTSALYHRQTAIENGNSIAEKYPEVVKFWDYSKNEGKLPEEFSSGVSTVVFWKCIRCGDSYPSRISHRITSSGLCKKCNTAPATIAKRMVKKYGSLFITNPELSDQWVYSLNSTVNPQEEYCKSNTSVYWHCPVCGDTYQQKIRDRVKGNKGCKCKVVLQSKNRDKTLCERRTTLMDRLPNIIDIWDNDLNRGLTPSDFTTASCKYVYLKCNCGHSYKRKVTSISPATIMCNKCLEEMQTSFPEQAIFYYISKLASCESRATILGNEFDIFSEKLNIAIEYDGLRYHSSNKRKEKTIQKSIICQNNGIRFINVIESKDKNVVEGNKIYFDYAKQDFVWLIDSILSIIGISRNFSVDVFSDSPEIYRQFVRIKKDNSLETKFPQIAKYWGKNNLDLKPSMFAPANRHTAWFICPTCGKEHLMEINKACKNPNRGTYCENCHPSHRRILDLTNKRKRNGEGLFDVRKDLINCYDPLLNQNIPIELVAKNRHLVVLRCDKCNFVWKNNGKSLCTTKYGCPKCENWLKRYYGYHPEDKTDDNNQEL